MEAMTREGTTEYDLIVAWLGSVFDLFAACLASVARDG